MGGRQPRGLRSVRHRLLLGLLLGGLLPRRLEVEILHDLDPLRLWGGLRRPGLLLRLLPGLTLRRLLPRPAGGLEVEVLHRLDPVLPFLLLLRSREWGCYLYLGRQKSTPEVVHLAHLCLFGIPMPSDQAFFIDRGGGVL